MQRAARSQHDNSWRQLARCAVENRMKSVKYYMFILLELTLFSYNDFSLHILFIVSKMSPDGESWVVIKFNPSCFNGVFF